MYLFKDVEEIVKEYRLYKEEEKISSSFGINTNGYYMYKGEYTENLKRLEYELKSFKQKILKHQKFIKVRKKGGKLVLGYTNKNKFNQISVRAKTLSEKNLIVTDSVIKYRKLFIDMLLILEKVYKTKYLNYLRFDIKSYYKSISIKLVIKSLEFISKKIFGIKTRQIKNIIFLLNKCKYQIFVDGTSNLYLGNYIGKLLSFFISLMIAFKIKSYNLLVFYEDDFFIFYRKDKRLNMEKRLEEMIFLLKKYELNLNFLKTSYGIFWKNRVSYLGYSFYRKRIKVSDNKIKIRKLRFVGIVENMKIENNRIINLKYILRKIRYGMIGFYNYYKLCDNIDLVINDLILFCKKLIRYKYYRLVDVNMFEVNKYLTNRKFKNLYIN